MDSRNNELLTTFISITNDGTIRYKYDTGKLYHIITKRTDEQTFFNGLTLLCEHIADIIKNDATLNFNYKIYINSIYNSIDGYKNSVKNMQKYISRNIEEWCKMALYTNYYSTTTNNIHITYTTTTDNNIYMRPRNNNYSWRILYD